MNKNKIVTVTLNPSLDKTLITSHLNIGYHNHVAETTHLDASGRGVNVSRALDRLGVPTLAIILLGNEAIGRAYRGLILEEEFPSRIVKHEGPTRTDSIIVDTSEDTETHIIDEGASCTTVDVQRVVATFEEIVEPGDTVVLAGTLPRDTAPDLYTQMTESVHQAGASVVLLAKGEELMQGLAAQPEMVTLTRLEAEALFNYPVRTYADMISGGTKLQDAGAGRVLMTAEDFSGAVLVEEARVWVVEISDIVANGTDSGVIDAMLAGYLSGVAQGQSSQDALARGAASLSFTASQIGNEFGSLNQVNQLLHRTDVRPAETNSALSPIAAGK